MKKAFQRIIFYFFAVVLCLVLGFGILIRFVQPRRASQGRRVVRDARTMEAAIDRWALENGKRPGNAIDTNAADMYLNAENGPPNPVELVSRIRENMTFKEIADIIPLSTNLFGFAGEHGGVWYDVALGTGAFVQLRFEYPVGTSSVADCKLNYPPKLSDNPSIVRGK